MTTNATQMPARRWRLALVIALAVGTMAACAPAPPDPTTTARNELAYFTNMSRQDHGVPGLWLDQAGLGRIAQEHAGRMAARGSVYHSDLTAVMRAANCTVAGENVGVARTTADLHQAWVRSTGHRNNILDGRFTRFGTGVALSGGKVWGVVVFCR